jgi:small subunit ribosomal protein S6
LRPYELMVIFDQDQDENDVKSSTKSYCDQISKAGASLGDVDHWGKRKFAYPINKKNEGYYVVIQAKAEPDVMTELSRQLGLDTEVVRHMVLRIPESQYKA